uniref:Putative disease resistance protein At5g63020 n=1 Tax=Rhizophora mucronata TaxID=61149 RepID=A0A2P2LU32_RHIMU
MYVKMHDVIRDMALWIASHCGQKHNNDFVQAGIHLMVAPNPEKWQGVEGMSLMKNAVESSLETSMCPALLTLFLNKNQLRMISSDFFNFMLSLIVLSLSYDNLLKELPSSVSNLVSLKSLNLSHMGIIQLPIELQTLTKLKCLNLEDSYEPDKIPMELMPVISRLQILRILNCGFNKKELAESILSDPSEF